MRCVPFVLTAILAAILSDGYPGGDEGAVYAFVRSYFEENSPPLWTFLAAAREGSPYLQHHFFWFFLQLAETIVLDTTARTLGIALIDELRNWILVYPLALMALLSAVVSYSALRRLGISASLAQLCLGILFFGGSVIGLLTGGFIECYMLLAVATRMLLLTPKKNGRAPVFFLVLVDWTLAAAKPYSLVFLAAMLPNTLARLSARGRLMYLAGMSFLCGLWFILKAQIPTGEAGPLEVGLLPAFSIGVSLANMFWATFSFSFGLIWTSPLLLLLGLPKGAIRSELIQKLLGIVALEAVFCLYPFWHGAAGMPGQRYILPFLLVLLPEMCTGLQGLIARSRMTLVGILVCIILFLPAIDFRNTLADSYARNSMTGESAADFGFEKFPMLDWSFHPGIFAWRLAIARFAGETTFPAAVSGGPLLNPIRIVPMTGISRIIGAVTSPSLTDSRLGRVRQIFSGWPACILEIMRGGLVLWFLAAMAIAAYRVGNRGRGKRGLASDIILK